MVGKSADQSTDFSNVQHVSHYAVFRTRLICGTRRLEINAAQSADFSEPQHTSCRTVFRIRLVWWTRWLALRNTLWFLWQPRTEFNFFFFFFKHTLKQSPFWINRTARNLTGREERMIQTRKLLCVNENTDINTKTLPQVDSRILEMLFYSQH